MLLRATRKTHALSTIRRTFFTGNNESFESIAERCINIAEQNKNNAFVTVLNKEQVIAKARESDQRKKQNASLSHIDGAIFSLKDAYCTKNIRTTMASKMLGDFVPSYNATILDKILNAGAVLVGKTNMDEFAMGSGTTFSTFGPTTNPIFTNEKYVAGGSSGGSSASVAEGSSQLYVFTCFKFDNFTVL
jgi:aspartyl-tRNA(Asn)/glutamyl-tRNA(Gln) amidotransferase subunit A